jgi:site-specific recombinase XerD
MASAQSSLQVYFDNKQRQIFTGLWIEEGNFVKDGKVTKHPNASWYNVTIKNKVSELEASYLRQAVDGSISIGTTAATSKQSFYAYGIAMYEGMKNRCSSDYIYRCVAVLDDFKSFAGDPTFEMITDQMLKEYEDHLFSRSLQRNSINRMFKRLKQVFKSANLRKITAHNPFNTFRAVTFKQPKRNYLTIEEMERLAAMDIPEGLQSVRNYFLLSCYTGLRYSDLRKPLRITKNQEVERLIIATVKTGETVSIKVTPRIRELMRNIKDPIPTNVHTNRLLKLIDIGQPLTFHMGRHSFAVNSAALGIPIEAVGRWLGHNSIRTTAIYYRITDPKLDEYMDRWT